MNNDGSIDPSNYQLLDDWNSGIRNTDLVTLVYGYDLMNILSNELGLVDVNDEGFLRSNIVITPDPNVSAMRLLGKLRKQWWYMNAIKVQKQIDYWEYMLEKENIT